MTSRRNSRIAMSSGPSFCKSCISLFTPPPNRAPFHSPRASDVRRCNDPPPDAELAPLKRDVAEWAAILVDLNRTISGVQALLDPLLAARTYAEAGLKDARSMVCPIWDIPNEVLLQIFHLCIPALVGIPSKEYNALDSKTVPWTLTHVCRRWRQLVRSTPSMWSYIQVDFKHRRPATAFKARRFLDLSNNLPLYVHVNSPEAWRALGGSERRWKYLRARLSKRGFSRMVEGTSLRALETLDLADDIIGGGPPVEVCGRFLLTAPNLRALHLGDCRALLHLALPWLNLKDLELHDDFSVDVLPVLRRMAGLERLTLHVLSAHRFLKPITLPCLAYLRLIGFANNEACSLQMLLEHMVLPALSELRLDFRRPKDSRPTPSWDLSAKCFDSTHLTILHVAVGLSAPDINTTALLDFLSLTPHVKEFRINGTSLTESFVVGMSRIAGKACRLPELSVLDIGDTYILDDGPWAGGSEIKAIGKMIYSRTAHNVNTGVEESLGGVLKEVHIPRWMYRDRDAWFPKQWIAIHAAMKVYCAVGD